MLQQASMYLPMQDYQLHLRNIHQQPGGVPVLMVHGAIENGKIFYTHSGKGLACYLAKQGFDVYVLDLRGRGQSTPTIDQDYQHGQTDSIVTDLPAAINFIYQRCQQSCHLVAHSWGGVLLASSLARFPELRDKIRSKVCFGTKRSVTVHNLERWFKVDICWKWFAPMIARKHGFFDAKKWKFGSDSETAQSLRDSVSWVKRQPWKDPNDSFDYAQAAKALQWPPVWHIAAVQDAVLGHPIDVNRFAQECVGTSTDYDYTLLSKANGNQVDYDHINMLTHPKAETDHFPSVAQWLQQHSA